jgi:hypothetical protein
LDKAIIAIMARKSSWAEPKGKAAQSFQGRRHGLASTARVGVLAISGWMSTGGSRGSRIKIGKFDRESWLGIDFGMKIE